MYKFYLLPGEVNEATSFYVDMIRDAVENSGERVEVVSSRKKIMPDDKVLTITSKAFFLVWSRNPKQYIMNWWQGIAPEEIALTFRNRLSKYPRMWIYAVFERIVLKYSKKNIFVSEAMLIHYQHKYGYDKQNYLLVPCFNQLLDETSFYAEKYASPSFVYAGSLSRWQCIDETLSLFKKIKNTIPAASLTLLTKETKAARSLCAKYGIEADIRFVSLDKLSETLKSFKYGFIVRDDIAVNNVATPTKMNSYMAAGIIPVYSDVVGDYRQHISPMKNVIPFSSEDDCVRKIVELERMGVQTEDVKSEYEQLFSSYWSRNFRVSRIMEFLR